MTGLPFRSASPVTLVGGGALGAAALDAALALAPVAVAADGAADALEALGRRPAAIVGDLDSLAAPADWERRGVAVIHLPEQETTDFEKCLYTVEAPFFIAVGFTGRRIDHMLAVLHAMLRAPRPVVLLGEADAAVLVPPGRDIHLALASGARVSVFPLLPVTCGPSEGLEWPLGGLRLAPGERIGTSNRATADLVSMCIEGPGALLAVEPRFLPALIDALGLRRGSGGAGAT